MTVRIVVQSTFVLRDIAYHVLVFVMFGLLPGTFLERAAIVWQQREDVLHVIRAQTHTLQRFGTFLYIVHE